MRVALAQCRSSRCGQPRRIPRRQRPPQRDRQSTQGGSRAADQAAWLRASVHAEAALALSADYGPDNFYQPEMWRVAARVALGSGREEAARQHVPVAQRWVRARLEHDVPPACHESLLRRNPVNAELATLAARLKP